LVWHRAGLVNGDAVRRHDEDLEDVRWLTAGERRDLGGDLGEWYEKDEGGEETSCYLTS
jgi:hypothetical protein